MMTSNAISKVTNMIAVKTKAVSSDFHSAIFPTTRMKAEKLRSQTEQQRRNEHRHDAAELRPCDEGFRSLLARQEGGDEAIEAGAGEDHRQIKREIAGFRAGR